MDPNLGHFGLFFLSSESKVKDDFHQIFPLIEEWFKKRGITHFTGPFTYSTYFPYRFRIDDRPESYSWEPEKSQEFFTLFQDQGLRIEQKYFTNFIENYGVFSTKGAREFLEAEKNGFSFKELNTADVEHQVKMIYDLSMKGFTDNHLFCPIPFELFRSLYVPSFMVVDLRTSCLQFDPDGKPVGFNFTFVSDHQIVIKSVCILPEYRGRGLLNAGIRFSIQRCMDLYPEIKKIATALVHAENGPSSHVANLSPGESRHEYVLLGKDV